MIEITCWECNKRLKIKDSLPGRLVYRPGKSDNGVSILVSMPVWEIQVLGHKCEPIRPQEEKVEEVDNGE